MKNAKIILKYLSLPVIFFATEVLFHGNEYIPLLLVLLFSVFIFLISKNRIVEVYLYSVGLLLGLFVEIGLTGLDRVQVWNNSNFLSIPLWLPFAWGLGAVLFYKLGKELEK